VPGTAPRGKETISKCSPDVPQCTAATYPLDCTALPCLTAALCEEGLCIGGPPAPGTGDRLREVGGCLGTWQPVVELYRWCSPYREGREQHLMSVEEHYLWMAGDS
jgi:hypothetical protein